MSILGVLNTQGAEPSVDYERQVKPLLRDRCLACHGALKQKAGLRLDTGALIRQGGDGGPAVEIGQAEESPLIERIVATSASERMPPEGSPLSMEQVATLRRWIEQGAKSPDDEKPEADPRQHWAFQPLNRPEVPPTQQAPWVRNPIDAFIADDYAQRGLTPLPPASPQVLLRRVYLDLIGLPPTREELREFLRDPSDAAYVRVVDRLLDSPRYGERWARHWMDVWRYSDWYGRRSVPDVTNSYAQIWRWRDWIVRSLNQDKGYDRMVQEMLAADELAPNDSESHVATGFLVRNWYRWNYNTWMKDNVEHTAKAFLGLTINCAHCHDHKYDPITQEDYFRLRACFEPLELRHDRVVGEPDPGVFPKYDYGKAYPPIVSGSVRVFDEKLDAKTFLYTRGESRNVVPGRPPIAPGAPAFLDRGSMKVEPVSLPVEAYYPGIRPAQQRETLAREEAAVASAQEALKTSQAPLRTAEHEVVARASQHLAIFLADPLLNLRGLPPAYRDTIKAAEGWQTAWFTFLEDKARLKAARARLTAVKARLAADRARYAQSPGDATILAREASQAERQVAFAQAAFDLAQADKARWTARKAAKPQAEIASAEAKRVEALKAWNLARTALAKESTEYAPFGPIYPAQSTGRRLALARWITDRGNPLTARVAANHLWRWHFGTPLVASTHDFGRNGKLPTHPQLLDWLAAELIEPSNSSAQPWSMKALHHLIVTSATYRRASQANVSFVSTDRAADPENQRYWHFPVIRMEAEVVRDSLLHLAQELDTNIGGPDIDFAQGLSSRRRSLYFTHHGEAKMPFLELFDAPDTTECYRRTTSVMPQQALALTNNEWLLALSQKLAERLWTQASPTTNATDRVRELIRSAFEQILARPPSALEEDLSVKFLERQAALLESAGAAPGVADNQARARRDFVHALFSHNDFITIR